jgi:hypothetical protein
VETDSHFASYLHAKHTGRMYPLFTYLPPGPRSLIDHMLDPDPDRRVGMQDVVRDSWFMGIEVGVAHIQSHFHNCSTSVDFAHTKSHFHTCLKELISPIPSHIALFSFTAFD